MNKNMFEEMKDIEATVKHWKEQGTSEEEIIRCMKMDIVHWGFNASYGKNKKEREDAAKTRDLWKIALYLMYGIEENN